MFKRALGPLSLMLATLGGCALDTDEVADDVDQESEPLAAHARSIQNRWTGWCLDVPFGLSNAKVGQLVNESPCHGGTNQQFVVEPISLVTGNVHIRLHNTQLCVVSTLYPGAVRSWLTLDNCSNDDGTTYSGGWQASSWPTTPCTIGTQTLNCPRNLNAGETRTNLTFRRFKAQSYCMDAPGWVATPIPNTTYGANWNNYPLQAYHQCHGGANQAWDIRN